MQEKGALVPVYKEVKRARTANPSALPNTGCRDAVEKMLGANIEKINADFRAWVLSTRD